MINRLLTTIDSHTMGEPTRIVTGGLPKIPGNTMADKKMYLENKLDYIRTALMHEPRGHKDMFGAIITAPVDPKADLGVIFMDSGGYLNMCGHGSIGVVTVAIQTGMVSITEPVTNVILDTPAGLIKARAKVMQGKVKSVTIQNVPAFLYKKDQRLDIPGIGDITLDIAFGGSFFAIVSAKELDIKVDLDNTEVLTKLGVTIRDIVNKQIKVQHPLKKHINTVDLVEIYDEATHPEADFKNVVIFGDGQVDRSPCGTGTSAKMATLFAKEQLKLKQDFIYESIIGTIFKGRLVKETKVDSFKAVVPEITAKAFITGFSQFLIDSEDPLKHGFLLGGMGKTDTSKNLFEIAY